MQKIRLQIFVDLQHLNSLHRFMIENHLKNESAGVSVLLDRVENYKNIVKKLQQKAEESELWKERANNRSEKATIAQGANDNITDSQKSIKDTEHITTKEKNPYGK